MTSAISPAVSGLPVDELSDPAAVTSALTSLLDVEALLDQIRGLLEDNLLSGALAELNGLINITGAAKSADGTSAIANSVASLQNVKLLGGLVDVGLLNLRSTSVATGKTGRRKQRLRMQHRRRQPRRRTR